MISLSVVEDKYTERGANIVLVNRDFSPIVSKFGISHLKVGISHLVERKMQYDVRVIIHTCISSRFINSLNRAIRDDIEKSVTI